MPRARTFLNTKTLKVGTSPSSYIAAYAPKKLSQFINIEPGLMPQDVIIIMSKKIVKPIHAGTSDVLPSLGDLVIQRLPLIIILYILY